MRSGEIQLTHILSALLMAMFCGFSVQAQQTTSVLQGRVFDTSGAVIRAVRVVAVDANGVENTVQTNDEGVYVIKGIAPGKYIVRAFAKGFEEYEIREVRVNKQPTSLDITMTIVLKESVTIASTPTTPQVNTDPENNASATRLTGSDLDILADDPDQLAADLQMLAGGIDGPNGTSLLVDGFSRGRLPSKSSILEVKINSNPFAAEQEEFGFGRIEIITKPGADKLHGQGYFNFNDESLNARNPFGDRRAPSQTRQYSGTLSGPLQAKKTSYFLDFERRDIDENAFVVATVLDPSLAERRVNEVLITPQRRTAFSARFDDQINATNTLVGRYTYYSLGLRNLGVGGFSLPERAYNSDEHEHALELTETMVVNPSTINLLRFQYRHYHKSLNGDNGLPTINVRDAFISGGAQVGDASTVSDRFELQNITSWVSGPHMWKAGGRLRYVHLTDSDPANFSGIFIFSSLDQYRDVLQGVAAVRPAQFLLNSGNPKASVSMLDFGGFVQDDWRARPNLTLSFGLRYEAQTNIDSRGDFAPRFSFAWAPASHADAKQPKTVIRGGAGLFYYRFSEDLTLLADRFNGFNQQQFVITDPTFFPRIPPPSELQGLALPQTVQRLAADVRSARAIRGTLAIERQLPRSTTLSISYIFKRDLGFPISRNINAPLPGTFVEGDPTSGTRPFGNAGNIFLFEPAGVLNSHTLLFVFNSRFSKKLTMFGQFRLRREYDNNDDSSTLPANPYDRSSEYSADTQTPTVFAFAGTSYSAPWGVVWNTTLRYFSGRRFNITTGRDANGDTVFTDRPALATDLTKPGVVVTPFGAFDPNPGPEQQIIKRNFGTGRDFFNLSMRVSKTFRFGTIGDGKSPKSEKRYSMTFSILAENILNHTNPGPVVGNLNSPVFGQSISSQGTQRRISTQLRFNF
jgi:hypothetical protein